MKYFSQDRETGTTGKKLPGPEPLEKNYRDQERDLNRNRFTGTMTGTIEKNSYRDQHGTGTKKTWSRTCLVTDRDRQCTNINHSVAHRDQYYSNSYYSITYRNT